MYAMIVFILHHALGQQTEREVIVLAPVVEAAESHVYALWPQAMVSQSAMIHGSEIASVCLLQKYKDIRSATILTIIASSTLCGVLGFALGRYFGGGSGNRR